MMWSTDLLQRMCSETAPATFNHFFGSLHALTLPLFLSGCQATTKRASEQMRRISLVVDSLGSPFPPFPSSPHAQVHNNTGVEWP